ncbi:MAG: hypothetical protein ACYCYQ_15615 [Acidimicrobiales bacterium]
MRDAGALSACYERLRAAVLSGSAGGWRLGHGVLCARGMLAWMSTVGVLAEAPPASGTNLAVERSGSLAECRELPTGRPVSLPDADQVVAVLSQMVLPLAA